MEPPPVQGQGVASVDISRSDTSWYQSSVIHFVWEGLAQFTLSSIYYSYL